MARTRDNPFILLPPGDATEVGANRRHRIEAFRVVDNIRPVLLIRRNGSHGIIVGNARLECRFRFKKDVGLQVLDKKRSGTDP